MRRIFRCGCCCQADEDASADAVSGEGVSGSYWNIWNSRGELKEQEQGTLPSIVTTEPSGSVTGRSSVEDFVDIEFPQGSYEDDRFSDMSATIFKRQQK